MKAIGKTLICALAVSSSILAVKAEESSGESPDITWPVTTADGTVYSVSDRIMTVTVPAGKTNDVAEAYLAPLLENTVTNVTKLGIGSLVMSADISDYEGDIFVNQGTWCLTNYPGLGKLSETALAEDVGRVCVSDGATLESRCTSGPDYYGKRIHVSGFGVDGKGALFIGVTNLHNKSTWGSNLILEGDTYASCLTDLATWYHNHAGAKTHASGLKDNGSITYNGYTLFLQSGKSKGSNGKLSSGFVVLSSTYSTDVGCIVVTNGTVLSLQGYNNFTNVPGARGKIVVGTGNNMKGNNWHGRLEWDVEWDTSNYLNTGGLTTSADVLATNKCSFHGAVRVAKNMYVTVAGGIGFHGPVTGGDVYLNMQRSTYEPLNRLVSFTNPNNDFSGDAFFRNIGLVLPVNGALPADDLLVKVVDCNIILTNVNYSLPEIEFKSDSDTGKECLVSGGIGSWRSFIKWGDGAIIWDSGVGAETLILSNGIVRLELSEGRAALLESGNTGLPSFGKLVFPEPCGTLDVAGYEFTADDVEGFPVVMSSAEGGKFTVSGGWTLDANDILAGKKATGVPLAFGAGSEFVVKNPNVLKETLAFMQPGKWLIAESSVAVAGSPSVEEPALARNWRVSVEGDKVYLKYYPSGTVISVR